MPPLPGLLLRSSSSSGVAVACMRLWRLVMVVGRYVEDVNSPNGNPRNPIFHNGRNFLVQVLVMPLAAGWAWLAGRATEGLFSGVGLGLVQMLPECPALTCPSVQCSEVHCGSAPACPACQARPTEGAQVHGCPLCCGWLCLLVLLIVLVPCCFGSGLAVGWLRRVPHHQQPQSVPRSVPALALSHGAHRA